MDYLRREGVYQDRRTFPTPDLILLDLNMPRKDGREALAEIKSDPALRKTPIVILTTSRGQEDVLRSYDLGANSFIVKPVSFDALCDLVRCLGIYWLEVVELPAL
jgi:CheY-like chemotaxis protein